MSRIALEDLFRRVIDVVEAQRIPFLVYGGLAKAIQKLGALAQGGGDPLGVYFLT